MSQTAPSEPVQVILDRLTRLGRRWTWSTNQYLAQCPAHEDNSPSLAIREGDDGARLYCHARCSTATICDALGLRESDLFYRQQYSRAQTPEAGLVVGRLTRVCDYLYEDEHGHPRFKVTRFRLGDGRKTFRQYHRNDADTAWILGLNGSHPPLYHLPRVLTAVANHEVVLIVEGEKDADAAMAQGICATTSPMGAGKWQPEYAAVLRDANVFILADDDPPGIAHALAVYGSLEGVAARIQLALPAEGCNDLSDHLEAGKHPWGLRFLTVEQMRSRGGGVAPAMVEEPVPPASRRITLRAASSITIKRVRWGWQDRMPIGEMTLIPGREGIGKSLFLAWMAANLTRGTLPGEFHGEPRAVLYAASEDSFEHTIVPRMIVAGADLDLIHLVEVEDLEDLGARLTLPRDCGSVAEAAIEVNAAALMLDPIVSVIDERLSVNQSTELRRALEPLRRCAENAELMVAALAHFNKAKDTDVLSKIPGARAWAEVARAAFGVAKDEEAGHYVGSQIKNNLGRIDLPHLTYQIVGVDLDTSNGRTVMGKLVWTGESQTSVSELLDERPERRGRPVSSSTSSVVDWVVDQGHAVNVSEVAAAFPDISRDNVRQILSRAIRRGTLRSPGYGFYIGE